MFPFAPAVVLITLPYVWVLFTVLNTISFKFIYLFIYLFIFGCVGSSLLRVGFSLVASSRGYTLRCGAQASHCSGFSCYGARALGAWDSVVVAHGLSSCGLRALEHRLSSCGSRA